jgi:purine-cytosine permease-like protein
MRQHRRGLPFPVAPLVFALVVTLVMVFGFHALLFVIPAMWLAGGIARRRAFRHVTVTGRHPGIDSGSAGYRPR